MQKTADVIIIGGGVVGSAIARELSRYRLDIILMEKNPDVGYETSGRNTGVCHGGFAYDTGSLKARFCVEGNRMMGDLARELDFPFKRCGKVLVGNTPEDREQLARVVRQGEANGARGLRMMEKEELHALVPGIIGEFALFSETSGILDPFKMTVALAENAAHNGVKVLLSHRVTGIRREENGDCEPAAGRPAESWHYVVETDRGEFRTRWVVNAAGQHCGAVSDMLGIRGYRTVGSKGDYILLDPRTSEGVPLPLYTVPSNTYMGIHVTLTVDGNLLIGPTAEPTTRWEYYGVEQKNLDAMLAEADGLWPHVKRSDFIREYSGILSKWTDDNGRIQDFRIEVRDDLAPRAVNLIGIESPGLTSAVPIARYVAGLIGEREELAENPSFDPVRKGIRRFADMTDEERSEAIAADPEYGEIVCRCQKVSRAEIRQAIENPLGVRTMTGIKNRTRAMTGRCQGGYCQMRISEMLAEYWNLSETELEYNRPGSNLFFGKVREER